MIPLFQPSAATNTPHLTAAEPPAAMPGGEITVTGRNLSPLTTTLPHATIGDTPARVILSRASRATVRIPEGAIAGDLVLHHDALASNPVPVRIAVPMADNLHPVGNPAVDANGVIFATVSGSRGQQVPVSIFRIERDFQMQPFVRGLLNASGIAFGPESAGGSGTADLYVSSRAEGIVYRIAPGGAVSTFAEGLGIATGLAFDRDGNLFVGDRSGTIFKIAPDRGPLLSHTEREIFVFATLEPSIAAYHLAFNDAGTLFVTGPTTSSSQSIHAIDRDGNTGTFFRGLGRPQGLAFDAAGNLYVAASYHGQRGLIRLTPAAKPSLALSGSNLVGLAFLEDGQATLATREALYHVDLGIEGRKLI